ncbi:hypothetical protein CQJ27_10440 [Escherichia sp. E1130]|nr:hypothetical protein CQJ27_10440 [Escherichia sp. E1130]
MRNAKVVGSTPIIGTISNSSQVYLSQLTPHILQLTARSLSSIINRIFFNALSGYTGSPLVVLGARLLIITGVRTGEWRAALWSEFNLDKAIWEIPAQRMKMRRPHIVPLSIQAITILKTLQIMTGNYPLVFPGRKDPNKCMSKAPVK